jgi:hypothetical protein
MNLAYIIISNTFQISYELKYTLFSQLVNGFYGAFDCFLVM